MNKLSFEELNIMFPGNWAKTTNFCFMNIGERYNNSYYEIAYIFMDKGGPSSMFNNEDFCLFSQINKASFTSDLAQVSKFYKKHFGFRNFI